ncbi:unnamed protein product [Plutella xylostella]|uniref:(diamondback moth) hypothetical protein n=1 Tax=Plutella xylostella TaxID=51655 RepID=A0A8S4D3C8_PLUXY|nr:unnamed protein product [Plutella xylostella]
MSASSSQADLPCPCEADTSSESTLSAVCVCPREEHGIRIHEPKCLLYKNETFVFPPYPESCECPGQPPEAGDSPECVCCECHQTRIMCTCNKAGREAFDKWRNSRAIAGALPAVLEPQHPLMQRFQDTLRRFLQRENDIAEEQILKLRDELKNSKEAYNKDLEEMYRHDHDTNAQRVLIEEYEGNLAKLAADRAAAESKVKDNTEAYKKSKEKLEQDIMSEREATQELDALTNLCRQLEQWRQETEAALAVSHNMSDKMKKEKRALADEKRQLDIIIFGLNSEIWKLESKLDMFTKQFEIKNNEMNNVNDKVAMYAAELEDLELEQRRLVSLWSCVLVNIRQRDKAFDSVKDDYRNLQENYRTLMTNLEVTKKMTNEEMTRSKQIAMMKDKLAYELAAVNKQYDAEDAKRVSIETVIEELQESIQMCERDQQLIKMENQTLFGILNTATKEVERKSAQKIKLENEILTNLQEILLNDKAVESMANGIKRMRDMARKQEIALMNMEANHAKVMFDIEVHKSRQAKNELTLQEVNEKAKAREKEVEELEEKLEKKATMQMRKQRELDIVMKKYLALKETCDLKSPQQLRIQELETQIRSLRDRAEQIQGSWLRLQGHVVRLATQHQALTSDANLISKQIQICEQKSLRIQAECDSVTEERNKVDQSLRSLRGKLEVLEHNRKDAIDQNNQKERSILTIAQEYNANLKGAESEILELEEEIENLEKDKENMTQELDQRQREALIWQRKGILAVELKKSIKESQSSAGEIGQMKAEIHRMEVRREQLRHIGERLAADLAHCVTQRQTAADKARAAAAVAHKQRAAASSQQHKTRRLKQDVVRLTKRQTAADKARAAAAVAHKQRAAASSQPHRTRRLKQDVVRLTKDISETRARMEELNNEQQKLERDVEELNKLNAELEERVAAMLADCKQADREKQWLLERVVRSQRLGKELTTAVKRNSLKTRGTSNSVQEYTTSSQLNDRLRYIVETLDREFPYLEDRLAIISNTLNIHSPTDSPRLLDGACYADDEAAVVVAEKPLSE